MANRTPEPPGRFSLLALLAGAKHEAGLAQLAADKYGQPQARGLAVPHLPMVRDLGVATAAGGGNLASKTQIERVADAIRPQLLLEQLGAIKVETTGVASVSFPRFTGGSSNWISEGEAAPTDATTTATVTATPHAAASRLGMSRQVRNQSGEVIEDAVLREISQAVAATIESGFFNGSGSSNEPLGLLNTPGIGSETFAAATPTLAELVAMIEDYAAADGDLAQARFILHPSDLTDLLKAQVDADGGETIVQFIDGAHRICGLPVFSTRHLTAGKIILLDPSAVACVYFGPAQVLLDEYSGGKALSGAAELVTFSFCDVCLLRPAQIVVGSS
jgi:HK97 family phage major capsid protein